MRVIFEQVDNEYFLEIIVTMAEVEKIRDSNGIIKDFIWENHGIKNINVYVTKENELCHSSKEKKQAQEKVSPRMSAEKCTKENHKNKLLQSLIAKRDKGKRKLPKKVKNE